MYNLYGEQNSSEQIPTREYATSVQWQKAQRLNVSVNLAYIIVEVLLFPLLRNG